MPHFRKFAATSALAAVFPCAGAAQELESYFIAGLGAVDEQVFSGSAATETDPSFYLNARRGRFFFNDRGAGVDLFSFGADDAFTISAALGYGEGRKEDDDAALAGLGDIDGSIEAALLFDGEVGPLEFGLAVVQDVGSGHEGLYFDLGAGVEYELSNRLQIEAGLSTRWANDQYSQAFYGISAGQSVSSGYSRYDAGSGFVSASVEIEATYAINDRTFLQLGIETGVLLGDAKDSPLTADDSFTSVGIGIARRF